MNKDRRKATAITAEKTPIACRPSLAEKMMGVFLLWDTVRQGPEAFFDTHQKVGEGKQ